MPNLTELEQNWSAINRARGLLIHKKVAKTITDDEQIIFDGLQAYAEWYGDLVAPRPEMPESAIDGLLECNEKLKAENTRLDFNFQMLALNWVAPDGCSVSVWNIAGENKAGGVCYPEGQSASKRPIMFPDGMEPEDYKEVRDAD